MRRLPRPIESKQLFIRTPKFATASCDACGDHDDDAIVGYGSNPRAVLDWQNGGEDAFLDSLDLDRDVVVSKTETTDESDSIFEMYGYAVTADGQVAEHFCYHEIAPLPVETDELDDLLDSSDQLPRQVGLRKAIIKATAPRNLRLCYDQTSSKKKAKSCGNRVTIRKRKVAGLRHPTRAMYDLGIYFV